MSTKFWQHILRANGLYLIVVSLVGFFTMDGRASSSDEVNACRICYAG